ncbi:MAG: energy-coupling factor ABC transporter ATP-binding protein [Treponema sp.]|jgi:biotin transport system ATP-binding protein|nr:energy-coupling factor ABC transporter ATP-binding protein [Treponema sp.]
MAKELFSVHKLSKVFPNGNPGISELSLSIFEGECLLITGANGSGKTLLMRMLLGLVEPTEGEIRFRGIPLYKTMDTLRREVGMVFQDADAQIIGETLEEDIAFGPKNLGYSKEVIQTQVHEALIATGLAEKKDFPPRRLSGGEKRRLAVAGILAMGGEVVIMDEPFANLDWPGVVQVLESIGHLKATGKTLIILTHELEKVLALVDRMVILHKGVIREGGAPEAILDRLDPAYGVRDPRRTYAQVRDCTWLTE